MRGGKASMVSNSGELVDQALDRGVAYSWFICGVMRQGVGGADEG